MRAANGWSARFPALAALGGPIFVATGLFMVATAIALAASWLLTRTLPIMPLVSGVVVFVFGALTLWLQDDIFIKMKPTIVNTLFGAVLLGGLWFGKSLLGYVFDSAFQLDAEGWRKLTFRWGLFFLFLAAGQRGGLALLLDRRLGGLQGLGHHADHAALHPQPDAADHAPFAGRADQESNAGGGGMHFITSRDELRTHLQDAGPTAARPQGAEERSTAIAAPSSARARSC